MKNRIFDTISLYLIRVCYIENLAADLELLSFKYSLIKYFIDYFISILERMMSNVSTNKDIKTTSSNVQDLFDFISDNGPLREELARKIFVQLVKTVQQITQAGVIHRDIKDENILIDTQTHQIKLIDFGSGARLHDEVYTDFDGK